jgi:hypothetical protein
LQRGFTPGRNRYVAGDVPITTANADELVELWRTDLGAFPNEPLAIGDDVYVTTLAGAAKLSASTGAVRWSRPVNAPDNGEQVGLTQPIYHDGEIVAGWGAIRAPGTAPQTFGGVVRLVPRTGDLVAPLTGGLYVSSDVAEERGQLVTEAEGRGQAPGGGIVGEAYVDWRGIRASPGLQTDLATTPFAVAGDHLVWANSGTAFGWNGTTCSRPSNLAGDGSASCLPDWQVDFSAVVSGQSAVGTDAAVWGVQPNLIKVLDAGTGAVQFTGAMPVAGILLSAPSVAGDVILIGASDGSVAAFPAGGCGQPTCLPLWEADLGSGVSKAPTTVGDVVYVTTDDGRLAALALAGCGAATCSPIASYPVGASGPVIYDNGRLIVATSDGEIVAFGLPPS